MAVTTENQAMGSKLARYGTGGLLAAGAVALLIYLRSEQGRQKMVTLFGEQFANIDEQIQAAMRENMPLIEEAIDRLIDTLQQGVSSLSEEINRLGDEVKERLQDYAALPEHAGSMGTESV